MPKSNKTSAAKRPRKPARATKPLKAETPEPMPVVTSNGSHVEVTVVTDGSYTFGRPTQMMPTSEHAVLNNLVSRDVVAPKEPLEPLSPTVTGLSALVAKMSRGEDISEFRAHIQQVAANQPEKGDVVRAYVNQADYELIADYVEMRANAVRHIKRATRRDEVSVSEGLVVWRMSNEQLVTLTKGISENDKAVDTTTVIEKIDFHRQQVERSVQQKWEGTTPQGRELIRKKLWELQRKVNAALGIHPPGIVVEPPEDPVEEPPTPAQNPA